MIRVAFVERKTNKNSITALAGALETSPLAGRVRLRFASDPLRPRGRDAGPDDCIAYSFHTADLPAVAQDLAAREAACGADRPLLLAGGPHATGDPEGTLALGFDAVLRGEGEASFLRFLEALECGGGLDAVPGLSRMHEGSVRHGPPAVPVDLDAWPPFAPAHRRFSPIEISRGCPHACAFCQTPRIFGSLMRHRSLDLIAAAAALGKARGLRDLRFVTPNAFAYGSPDGRTPDLGAVEALLERTGAAFGRDHVWFGSFPSEVRPEWVTAEAVALVARLAANDNLVLGAQSGSDRVLARLGRGHDVDAVERAVEVVRAAGLTPIVDFIFGFPFEEEADRAATRALATRLADRGALVHSHAFMPLPGTPLAGAAPRRLDRDTTCFLGALGREGRHIGRWKQQQDAALEALELQRRARRPRPGLREK